MSQSTGVATHTELDISVPVDRDNSVLTQGVITLVDEWASIGVFVATVNYLAAELTDLQRAATEAEVADKQQYEQSALKTLLSRCAYRNSQALIALEARVTYAATNVQAIARRMKTGWDNVESTMQQYVTLQTQFVDVLERHRNEIVSQGAEASTLRLRVLLDILRKNVTAQYAEKLGVLTPDYLAEHMHWDRTSEADTKTIRNFVISEFDLAAQLVFIVPRAARAEMLQQVHDGTLFVALQSIDFIVRNDRMSTEWNAKITKAFLHIGAIMSKFLVPN